MHLIGSSLSCKREGKLIFSELSFKVSSGEICLIKGPNGSGKSTLLRLLAGFLKVSSGEITLDNKKITNKKDVIYDVDSPFEIEILNLSAENIKYYYISNS